METRARFRYGSDCKTRHCLGVVDVVGEAGAFRSQPVDEAAYPPYARCGWRIAALGRRVVLEVRVLGLEEVYDVVRIYAGAAAPPGLGAVATDRAPLYELRGSTPLAASLIFEGDVFVRSLRGKSADESRRRRGCDVRDRHRRVAAPPRPRRFETGARLR